MKQKITFLSIIIALFGGISQTAVGQSVYQQNFDGGQFPPPGCTVSFTPTTAYNFGGCATSWAQATSNVPMCTTSFGGTSNPVIAAHSGSGMAGYNLGFIYDQQNFGPVSTQLKTPALNFTIPSAQYRINFWVYDYNYFFTTGDAFNVYISTSPTGPFTTPILSVPVNTSTGSNAWKEYSVVVPATFNGPTNYVVFEVNSPFGETADVFLDDINIGAYLPCAGTPNSVISGPTSVCGGIPFTLADNSTPYSTGITYQWQSRLTGTTTFTNIIGATSNTLTTSIGIPTDYRLTSICTNSNHVDTTAPYTVNINAFYNCYCGPATGTTLGGSAFPLLDSVSVAPSTLAHPSFGPIPGFYASYPPVGNATANLQQGGNYTVHSILSNFNANSQAWVDFDQNGSFDPSEWIDMTTPNSSNVASGSFTIPQNALTGLTGLRVRSGGTNDPNSACSSTGGEVEDFVVNIIPAPVNDMGATLILQPLDNSSICANTNFVVKAVIMNLGTAAQSNVIVKATYGNGSANNTIYANYQPTLASFATDTFTIGTMSIPTQGTYTIKAYTTLANDANTMDDTAFSTIRVKSLPANPVVISDSACVGDNAQIGVNPVSGNTYNWYNSPIGGSVVYTGTSMTINSIANTTTYYVSSSTNGVVSHLPANALTNGTEGCNDGITFDIQALTNLTVDSFAARFSATGTQQVNIYYRAGTAAGNETNPNAWVLVGTAVVNVTSTSATYFVNPHVPLILTSGDTYGIYLDYNAAYSDAGGTATYTDGNMTVDFTNGLGLCSPFGSPSATNMYFNGSVYYHVGGSDCESNRIPVFAAVGPRPVVNLGGSDITVCQSPSLMLDAGNPGASYLWNTGETTEAIHIDTSGTYTVIVDKYCADTASVHLFIDPLPTATGINYTRSGNTYSFAISGKENVTGYYWKFGDGGTSTDSTPVHTYPSSHMYNITLAVYNNCGTDTIFWTIPTSVGSVNKNDNPLVLYPNPASSSLTISGNDNMEINDVTIINAIGAVVYKGDLKKVKSGTVNISNLASGHYILRANTSEGYYNQPFDVLRN